MVLHIILHKKRGDGPMSPEQKEENWRREGEAPLPTPQPIPAPPGLWLVAGDYAPPPLLRTQYFRQS